MSAFNNKTVSRVAFEYDDELVERMEKFGDVLLRKGIVTVVSMRGEVKFDIDYIAFEKELEKTPEELKPAAIQFIRLMAERIGKKTN